MDRDLLYSAIILRKLVEDDAIAKKEINSIRKEYPNFPMPLLKSLNVTVPVLSFEYVGEESIIQRVCTDDYKNAKKEEKNIKDICNWIIHSYVWRVTLGASGFIVASDYDKSKTAYFVDLDDYIKALKDCFGMEAKQ